MTAAERQALEAALRQSGEQIPAYDFGAAA